MSKRVEVWMDATSEPLVHDAVSTYTKGPMFCVYRTDGQVHKYPVSRLFRVVEGYGTHGGERLTDICTICGLPRSECSGLSA